MDNSAGVFIFLARESQLVILRVSNICQYESTSNLECSERGARPRTRGSAMGLHVSCRIDGKVFVVAILMQSASRPGPLNATCRAGHIAIVCE